jgi:hypothetical protein
MAFSGKKLGNLLIAGGAVLGVLTVVAIVMDYAPTLSPEMIKLMFHKGMAAGAAGLLIVGSWIARGSRRSQSELSRESGIEGGDATRSLNQAAQPPIVTSERDTVRIREGERR